MQRTNYKNCLRELLAVFLMIFLLFTNVKSVLAAGNDFSVKVLHQDNPAVIEKKVRPNAKFRVELLLENNSNKPQKLRVALNPAFTGDSGIIQYNLVQPGACYFGKAKVKAAAGPKEVMLKPHAKMKAIYKIQAPKQKFSGTALGGFYISQQSSPAANKRRTGKSQIGYQNQFAYVIPVVLKQNNKVVHTKLALQQVKAAVSPQKPVVFARIANLTPTAFGQLTVTSEIVDAHSQRVLIKNKKQNMAMAPLSYFNYRMPLTSELAPGTYLLKLQARSGERRWQFKRSFRVSNFIAQKTRVQNARPKMNMSWLKIAGGVILLIVLLLLAYRLGKRH